MKTLPQLATAQLRLLRPGAVALLTCAVLTCLGARSCPEPTPPNPPTPHAALLAVVIEDPAARTPAHAQILASAEIAGWLKQHQAQWIWAPIDAKDPQGNTPAKLKPYIERAAGKPLPQILLLDAKGQVQWQSELPSDPASTLKLLEGQSQKPQLRSATQPRQSVLRRMRTRKATRRTAASSELCPAASP
jgi:hypothetical protein